MGLELELSVMEGQPLAAFSNNTSMELMVI